MPKSYSPHEGGPLKTLVRVIQFVVVIACCWTALVLWRHHSEAIRPLQENTDKSRIPAMDSPKPTGIPDSSFDTCQNIYRLVCQKPGESRDRTGMVRPDIEGEKLALKIYREIIQKHRDWSVEQIDEELVQQIFDRKRRGRIESAFRWVLHAIEHFIDQQPLDVFTPQEKRQLKTQLRKTQLQLPPPASIYADEPDLLTRNEAYYERTLDGQMRLRVGGAYVFVAKSWFNLVDTLSHELAHSIDPCEIRTARLSFPAYDRLTACFLRNHIVATPKNRTECGDNDQLSETFADWVAAQIISEALTIFSTEFKRPDIINAARNSVRDLCEQGDDSDEHLDLDLYPSPQVRIEKIFGSNPKIRQLLGCPVPNDRLPYCTFSSEKPRGSHAK